jgi:hypothetical protein
VERSDFVVLVWGPGPGTACGTCEIPPASGPCVNGLCEVGVAYCDLTSKTCQPVRLSGASCADSDISCAPGLFCDSDVCGPRS